MNRSRWLLLGVAVFIVSSLAWYLGSPAYTLSKMKAASEANDAEALATYIDFPALREDLKADLLAQMMVEVQKDKSPFSGFAMAIGPAMVGSMVDGFVTPAGIKAAFASKKANASAKPKQAAASAFQLDDQPIIKRRGFSEFSVASRDEPDSGMVFKRDGLSWKLSGVDLPPAENSEGLIK